MPAKKYETFIVMNMILILIQSDSSLQEKFKSMPLAEFWLGSKDEYPQLSKRLCWYFYHLQPLICVKRGSPPMY